MVEGQKVQVDVSRVIPIFADEVMVISRVKSKKSNDGKNVVKEGHIELIFLDQISQPPKAISRVVVSRHTAEGLTKILSDNLSKLDAELKSKKMPEQPKAVANTSTKRNDQAYLG